MNRLKRCGGLFQFKRDHLSDDLRIGLADARDATSGQSFAKLLEILNDAVVDQMNPVVFRSVRVRVDLRHTAVGGPSGVSDAERAFDALWKDGFEVSHFPHRFVRLNAAVVFHGDAG